MNVIKKLSELPPTIQYEGVNFELRLTGSGSRPEMVVFMLSYEITSCEQFSKHKKEIERGLYWRNPFLKECITGYLCRWIDIKYDIDLKDAINGCKKFLMENNLIIIAE